MNTRYLPAIFFGILCIKLISSSAALKNEKCYTTKDKKICYFRGSQRSHTWNDSKNICASKNHTLPSFINTDEKETLASYFSYLESKELDNFGVWSAGRRIAYDNWTWVNDQIWNSSRPIHSENNGSHVVAAADASLSAQNPSRPSLYVCQYSGDLCRKVDVNVVDLGETCIQFNIAKKTWYKARNDCLYRGGDLAFINKEDTPTLVRFAQIAGFHQSDTYWIGLRKVSWVWITHFQSIKGQPEQVKFTDWSDLEQNLLSGDVCIYMDAKDGKWRTSDCSNAMSVICQRKEVIESSSDGSSTEVNENPQSGLAQYVTIGSVIAVAGFVCVTSIVIAVLVTKRKTHVGKRRDTSVEGQYQDLKRKQSNTISEVVVDDYESIGPEVEQNTPAEVAYSYATIGLEDKHCENTAFHFCNSAGMLTRTQPLRPEPGPRSQPSRPGPGPRTQLSRPGPRTQAQGQDQGQGLY